MRVFIAAAALTFSASALAQTLYVSDQQGGVTVLNGSTLARIGQIDVGAQGPRGIAVTHDGKFLLTANQAAGDLSVVETPGGGGDGTRLPARCGGSTCRPRTFSSTACPPRASACSASWSLRGPSGPR